MPVGADYTTGPGPEWHLESGRKAKSWKLPSKFKLVPTPRMDPSTAEAVERTAARLNVKSWFLAHCKVPPAASLHPAVQHLMTEWFEAVDEDGSGKLDYAKLSAALKAAQMPASEATILEIISLMDVNKDGEIGWKEFVSYMADEFNNGKNLLEGEYMLPSGTTINFGVMISKLKRNRLMKDILEGSSSRKRWADVAADPGRLNEEIATMERAAQASLAIHESLVRDAEHKGSNTHHDPNSPRTQAAHNMLSMCALEAKANKLKHRDSASRAAAGGSSGGGAAAGPSAAATVLALRCSSQNSSRAGSMSKTKQGLGILLQHCHSDSLCLRDKSFQLTQPLPSSCNSSASSSCRSSPNLGSQTLISHARSSSPTPSRQFGSHSRASSTGQLFHSSGCGLDPSNAMHNCSNACTPHARALRHQQHRLSLDNARRTALLSQEGSFRDPFYKCSYNASHVAQRDP